MPPRRISYVIPAPQTPPPQLELPAVGVPRNGQTSPLFIPADSQSTHDTHDTHEPARSTSRPSHPQHRLPVSALAIDKSTQLLDRSSPEGILYTSGRDGLVAAWELGVPMKRRSTREKDRKRHWEALTGWDEADDSSDEEDEEDAIGKPPRPKRALPPVDENGWAYEDRWEVAGDSLQPAQFRQSVQLHTDWINDIVLCNMNQTVVSASSDGTLRTYNPHSTGTPNILGTHSDYVRCLAYAPGPRWVASGSFDRTVKIWDVSRAVGLTGSRLDSSAELTSLSMSESDPKASIYAIATDPAGTLVAAGGPERVVRVWDPRIATGGNAGGEPRCLSTLRGHTDNIRAILISEDGRYQILTGSSDASIKLWSLPMRRCIHTFSVHSDSVWALHSTHPQLHNFLSGDRAGWICRFDVTQPVRPLGSETFNPTPSIQYNPTRSPVSPGFASTHTPRHSIAGTLNLAEKGRGDEMDLSDAFCVVIGRAGYEARNEMTHSHHETERGITALTSMDDTWVWTASGNSSVQRWRNVGALSNAGENWGSRVSPVTLKDNQSGPSPPARMGSPPPRVGSPGPRPPHVSPPNSSFTSPGRKRVSIDVSHTTTKPEPEIAPVAVPARIPSATSTVLPQTPSVLVPYTTLVRLAEPNPFKLNPHDPETATLYSHSGASVHWNVHREDLAMGSGFFGLPPSGNQGSYANSLYKVPPLSHTSSLPLVQTTSPGAPPSLNHTTSNLPLTSPPLPHPNTLPIASDVSETIPLSAAPADEITGSYGLVRSVVLNDRVHALSVDTRGEVAVWDVVRGICRGVFVLDKHQGTGKSKLSPREALDLVRDRIEGESMTPAWIKVDTRVGDLTVHLEEPKCFDAEVYADELSWVDLEGMKLENPHEHRLNLGKWVLVNLFAEFIQAERALSAELTAPTPRAVAAGLPSMAVPNLPPVDEGQATQGDDGINSIPASPRPAPGSPLAPATPLALGSIPLAPSSPVVGTGLRTPRATHISLTARPTHIPIPSRTRSASEASVGGFGLGLGLGSPAGSGLGSATLAPMMTPAILPDNDALTAPPPNVLSPIRELQSPGMLPIGTMSPGQISPGEKIPSTTGTTGGPSNDYFSAVKAGKEKEGAGITSPTEPVTPGGGGLMGRLKNLGKAGKRGPVVPGTPGGISATLEETATTEVEPEVEEKPDPERMKHLNHLSSLLSSQITPPHPNEAPPVNFPPHTIVTISEMTASAEASGGMVLFSGSVGGLGADVEALEMALPGWLLEYLLANRFTLPPSGAAGQKMGFLLLPWKGDRDVLPELVGSQSRLTASRFLRVSKVAQYVHDKLLNAAKERQIKEPTENSEPLPEENIEYEVLCNEQVLSVGMTLAAVRQYVWRNAGELTMHYRIKEA
ncbi:hypothetical protein RHS03_07615, partial [Rhizoctonia solani]